MSIEPHFHLWIKAMVSNICFALSCKILKVFSLLLNQIRRRVWKLRREVFEGGKERSYVFPTADYTKEGKLPAGTLCLVDTVWLCYLSFTAEGDSSLLHPVVVKRNCSLGGNQLFVSKTAVNSFYWTILYLCIFAVCHHVFITGSLVLLFGSDALKTPIYSLISVLSVSFQSS